MARVRNEINRHRPSTSASAPLDLSETRRRRRRSQSPRANLSPPHSETYSDNIMIQRLGGAISVQQGEAILDVHLISGPQQTSTENNVLRFRAVMQDGVLVLQAYGNSSTVTDEDMSYEELLELGEHIGGANLGLSEETILKLLNTRIHRCSDKNQEICSVCQVEFRNRQRIGTLDCGHHYHVDCIKQWLLLKNDCPMCRRTALLDPISNEQ